MTDILSKVPRLTMGYSAQPYDNIVTGGQPTPEDLVLLKQAGIDNVINMRMPGEQIEFNDAQASQTAGLNYIAMPIGGEPAISLDAARELDAVLGELEGNTLVHCATSNRVGALFAIRAALIQGKPMEEAINEGRAAGLSGLLGKAIAVIEAHQ